MSALPTDADLPLIELDLDPNEASALLDVASRPLLDEHGWDFGFWVVLDEGVVHDCVAVIGHRAGEGLEVGWDINRLHAKPDGTTKTEDAEALARHDGWIYVFGSHFGSKAGPLEARRSFVARFREADVQRARGRRPTEMQIVRDSFLLHRLVNDALAEHGQATVPLGRHSRAAFIDATVELGRRRGKRWEDRVRPDDLPLNVEGSAFRDDGTLLLGLRFPVAADGRPLLVDIDGLPRLFEQAAEPPVVRGFWAVDAIGRDGDMAGVRDMTMVGDELHLVTGNIDAKEKNSVLLEDYERGRNTVATHFACRLPAGRRGGQATAEALREFPSLPRIEGIAAGPDGHFFYVSDEDEGVHVRHTALLVD